jgi:hypothetical protein
MQGTGYLQVFQNRQIALDPIGMAYVSKLALELRPNRLDRGPTPLYLSGLWGQQTAQGSQQAGLTAAIAPGNLDDLPGFHCKAQFREDQALATAAGEIAGGKPMLAVHSLLVLWIQHLPPNSVYAIVPI